MSAPHPTIELDLPTLTGVVRQIVSSDYAAITEWQIHPIRSSRGAATGGIYWLTGAAREQSSVAEWSLVIKVVAPMPDAPDDPAHPLYWRREALVYQSGLLADLPGGLNAPRCYAITAQADGSYWLWLEALPDGNASWTLAQYTQAAACLGRFNGAYLTGQPLPGYHWLVRGHVLRDQLEHLAWLQEAIQNPLIWAHPLVRDSFSPTTRELLRSLCGGRGRLLDGLEQLPQTLCHNDAFRRNLFAPTENSLVAIDWAYLGLNPLATDAADLIAASYSTFGITSATPEEFSEVVFAGYLAGLRAAGWQGGEHLARFGYAAYAALKYCSLLLWLPDVLDEQRWPQWEQMAGRPMAEFIHQQAVLTEYLLELAAEAHRLIGHL
jgi:hypothetical protein